MLLFQTWLWRLCWCFRVNCWNDLWKKRLCVLLCAWLWVVGWRVAGALDFCGFGETVKDLAFYVGISKNPKFWIFYLENDCAMTFRWLLWPPVPNQNLLKPTKTLYLHNLHMTKLCTIYHTHSQQFWHHNHTLHKTTSSTTAEAAKYEEIDLHFREMEREWSLLAREEKWTNPITARTIPPDDVIGKIISSNQAFIPIALGLFPCVVVSLMMYTFYRHSFVGLFAPKN